MNVLFYLGHPDHFHLFKNLLVRLHEHGHRIEIVIKKKDILETLLKDAGYSYKNIFDQERGESKYSILKSLVQKDIRLLKIANRFKPDIMMGTSIEITHVGMLLNVPAVIVNEDDFDVVPAFAKLGYLFAKAIIAPNCCRVGKWQYKKIGYEGYHELAYLHPAYFRPNKKIVEGLLGSCDRFYVLRFAKLKAYHDKGKTGINSEIATKLTELLSGSGKVVITAEEHLEPDLEKYRLNISPLDIHHFLAFAYLYIGDSQTMAAEAAVLGTPSIRFNDFVGRIGYLEELEFKYGLTFGFKTSESEKMLSKIISLVEQEHLGMEWDLKKQGMLNQTIDLNDLLFNYLLENNKNKR